MLDFFPLACYKALELLITLGFEIDAANLSELSGADGVNLCLLSHDVQNENFMFTVSYQKPVVLVEFKLFDESEVDFIRGEL